jgi:hypothetical protein
MQGFLVKPTANSYPSAKHCDWIYGPPWNVQAKSDRNRTVKPEGLRCPFQPDSMSVWWALLSATTIGQATGCCTFAPDLFSERLQQDLPSMKSDLHPSSSHTPSQPTPPNCSPLSYEGYSGWPAKHTARDLQKRLQIGSHTLLKWSQSSAFAPSVYWNWEIRNHGAENEAAMKSSDIETYLETMLQRLLQHRHQVPIVRCEGIVDLQQHGENTVM